MKHLIYPLLTLSILFTIGCEDDKKVQPDTVTDIDGNVYQTVCI